jgi:AcrR family transcriptional regulator
VKIVAATRSMIEAEGLDAVSLRRVASALGVTAPALSAHVADKEDLLRGVAEGEFERIMVRFGAIDDPDPVERIRRWSRSYISYALENPRLFRVMFLFPPELPDRASTGHELAAATKAFDMALGAIRDAIDQGSFAPSDPLVAAMAAWASTHGVADVLTMGFEFDEAMRQQITTTAVDAVIRGLST